MGQGSNFGMNAGNSLQGYNQAQLNDMRQRFEDQRDFEMQQRTMYNAGILGRAPNSSQNVVANMHSPLAGAINGGMAGYQRGGMPRLWFWAIKEHKAW